MAIFEFRLPDIGEGIAEAEIVVWHVKTGDAVEEDAPLADVMTDKATVEMTAPVAGTVLKIAGKAGDMVAIGSILAVFETEAEGEKPLQRTAGAEMVSATQTLAEAILSDTVGVTIATQGIVGSTLEVAAVPAVAAFPPAPEMDDPSLLASEESKHALASPAVRQRAKQLGIDLSEVKPADSGRVRHSDLDAFLSYNSRRGYSASRGFGSARRADEQVKVIGLRRRIAQNMAASKRAIPHFTYVEEIDATKIEALRADLNATRGTKPKLTMLPLLITAMCKTLPDFPMINARYDDEAGIVTRSGSVHLGMAVQTDAGLMVPVIRDAQDCNIWQLAAEIVRLAGAARTGEAKLEELTGSTLTITSLGPLGGIVTTPVINRPEVAIIGPNRVVERPVYRDGAIVVAKMMNLSVSCDHRVVDGWDAASFVQALKRLIETPALLFADA